MQDRLKESVPGFHDTNSAPAACVLAVQRQRSGRSLLAWAWPAWWTQLGRFSGTDHAELPGMLHMKKSSQLADVTYLEKEQLFPYTQVPLCSLAFRLRWNSATSFHVIPMLWVARVLKSVAYSDRQPSPSEGAASKHLDPQLKLPGKNTHKTCKTRCWRSSQ